MIIISYSKGIEGMAMKLVPEEHYRNREQFPATELAKYYGKEVAWSLDGLQIVASGDDPLQVCAAVKKAGLNSEEVVLAYVPFPDEAILGSAWLADAEDAE
jgi:hypothetical protein